MEIRINLPESRPSRFVKGPADDCGAKQFLDIHTHILYAGANAPTMPILGEDNRPIHAKQWHIHLSLDPERWERALEGIVLKDVSYKRNSDYIVKHITNIRDFESWRNTYLPVLMDNSTKIHGKYSYDRTKDGCGVTITCGSTWVLDLTVPVIVDVYDMINYFKKYGFDYPGVFAVL